MNEQGQALVRGVTARGACLLLYNVYLFLEFTIMPIVAERNSLGSSATRNLDATVILNHVKCIMQNIEYLVKPALRATLHLLLR